MKQHPFKFIKLNYEQAMQMQIKAIYEKNVFKPLEKLDLKEKTQVRIYIRKSFYNLLDELGEIEANTDIDQVFETLRVKKYYG
jgi:predicted DNA-binding antitoxin AbrB/MazE fold protein